VFSSKDFLKQRVKHPERYWVSLLCLFQCCRREEPSQLALADLGEKEGIPFLHITDEGESQGLKNASSRRKVPIHSSLIQLGFFDYVNTIKKEGHVRLFPQLKERQRGVSDVIGKWFGRHLDACGVVDPLAVMHSLRKSGITKLHAAGVPENLAMILAGHESKSVHGRLYVDRGSLPLSLLRDGLEKLRYEEVVKVLVL